MLSTAPSILCQRTSLEIADAARCVANGCGDIRIDDCVEKTTARASTLKYNLPALQLASAEMNLTLSHQGALSACRRLMLISPKVRLMSRSFRVVLPAAWVLI